MIDINKKKNISVLLLLLTAMIFMGTGVISKAEAGLPLPPTETLSIPIGNGSDDAEENTDNGDISLTSSDLEFIRDGSKLQILGLRFPLAIPAGATILNATIQFTVDETGSDPTSLTIHGQDTNNAPTFSSSDFDISLRALTSESISWAPPAWPNKGDAGSNQKTPDLSAIVQASVDQPDWMQDNAIAFIISGNGKRVAESFDGTASPVLQVEFSLAPQLRITEVAVDTDILTITGEAFDFNNILDLEVTLGDSSTGNGPGDITSECTSSTFPTDTRIVCDLSASGLPEVGDYLLTVSNSAGQSQSDEYGLTIGAVGPQGDRGIDGLPGNDGATGVQGEQGIQGLPGLPGNDGADGAQGPQGPKGDTGATGPQGLAGTIGPQQCPEGLFITGVDNLNNIICREILVSEPEVEVISLDFTLVSISEPFPIPAPSSVDELCSTVNFESLNTISISVCKNSIDAWVSSHQGYIMNFTGLPSVGVKIYLSENCDENTDWVSSETIYFKDYLTSINLPFLNSFASIFVSSFEESLSPLTTKKVSSSGEIKEFTILPISTTTISAMDTNLSDCSGPIDLPPPH